METKAFDRIEWKASPEGRFTALISTYNVVDKKNDIVRSGAFRDTIAEWQRKGDPVPVIFSHRAEDPDAYIGAVDPHDLRETSTGLEATGQIDLDDPAGAKVFKQLRARTLREWSYGYVVKRARNVANGVRELLAVDLVELGPTLVGAGDTMTLSTKGGAGDREREARDPLAPYRAQLDLAVRRAALEVALARGR